MSITELKLHDELIPYLRDDCLPTARQLPISSPACVMLETNILFWMCVAAYEYRAAQRLDESRALLRDITRVLPSIVQSSRTVGPVTDELTTASVRGFFSENRPIIMWRGNGRPSEDLVYYSSVQSVFV
jgi:hypothetical protein